MRKTVSTTELSPDSGSTADTLLDTAEHLFARQGIENVSMRRIALECGHGNRSGALYHFGSRESLIRTLLERRMAVIDRMRHQRLDALVAMGREHDLAAIVDCAVEVLADVVRQHPWGADYVMVVAQALSNPRVRPMATLDARAMSGYTRTTDMARALLPHLTPEKFDARMRMVLHETTAAFSRWLHFHGDLTRARLPGFNAMVRTVAEFMVGGLAAPIGAVDAPSPSQTPAPRAMTPRRPGIGPRQARRATT